MDPSIVYMGTGEASAGLVGLGAFKSTDAGVTWQYLPATNVDANPDWRFVNRIATHPTQSGVVLAAMTNNVRTLGAIYRSTDGGARWKKQEPALKTPPRSPVSWCGEVVSEDGSSALIRGFP